MAAEFKIGRLRYTWKGAWAPATFYNRDAVASYNGKSYVCIFPHTSSDFYADYENVEESGEVKPYWVIMTEGTTWKGEWLPSTLYNLGAIVLYGGAVYQCIVNHTSTSTITLSNWESYFEVNSTWIGDYALNQFYKIGDTVKYGGIVYRCTVEHTSSVIVTHPTYANWEILYSGIDYKGTWSSAGFDYKINDVVKFGANLWQSSTNHESSLPFDDSIWSLWMPGTEYVDTWDIATIYQPGDVVVYGGYSYIGITVNNDGNNPSTSTANWQLLTVGYTVEADWSTGVSYKIGAVVRRGGNLFEAVQDTQGQDPTGAVISTTYVAAGSGGTTLIVDSTTGIKPGMIISGNSFDKGQFVTEVVDSETLIISHPPYESIVNLQTLTFLGVNGDYWSLIVPGVRWRNRWTLGQEYIQGDIVVWVNKTYRAIKTHMATLAPNTDNTFSQWVIYLDHDRFNVLNIPGDIVVNSNGNNQALAIGAEGYLLKSVNGIPTWANVFRTPNVFYVTPDGTDAISSGTTWDNPYRSIRYACQQIGAGTQNAVAKSILTANKPFIVEEAYAWMIAQIANGIPPFNTSPTIDEVTTKRDARFLVDAIIYDLARGGNSQVVAYTYAFFDKEYKDKFISTIVDEQILYFIATLNHLFTVMYSVAQNIAVSTTYQTNVQQIFGTPVSTQVITDIQSFQDIVITAFTDADTSTIPPENQGLTATLQVKTGSYYEQLPIVIPANTALNGDELRGVTVFPLNTIRTVATKTTTTTITVGTTAGMINGTPVQFVSVNPITELDTVFGDLVNGVTYYVIGSTITPTTFSVSETVNGPLFTLTAVARSRMYVYGGDALSDMFYVQNGTGIRNMTLSGLLGTLTTPNLFTTRRPTGGSYVSLDPGTGPDDTSAWIYRKSPYIQNVTTFGVGCVGCKIDGTLHNGGNKSMVSNDFTQIVSDGIGIYCTGPDALTECVSVFSYYAYSGYMAENGGRIRATNGNSSYGTFGVIAEGFDNSENPITGRVNNRYYQASATPFSSLGSSAEILKVQYSHAGEGYNLPVTNMLNYSNQFTNWSTDGNITLIQSIVSPYGQSEAWIATGNTSGTASSYIYQNVNITPSGASYTAVSGLNITGSGLDASFDILVTSSDYIVSINSGGTGYVSTNQIRILGSQLGGIDDTNDLIITVTGLSGTTITNISTTGIVQVGAKQDYTFSIFCKKGTSPSIDVEAIYSGYSTLTSSINFNFDTLLLTSSSTVGGMMPVVYSATAVSSTEVGWYRLSFVFNDSPALNNALQIRIYPRSKFGNTAYTTLYGAQLEIGNTIGFYLKTTTNKFTAYANFDIVGAGTGVDLVAEETRSASIYQSRIVQDADGYTGGKGYLSSSNNAQTGDNFSIVIAASDVAGDTEYLGMRLFVNSGTGAGQYGTVADYDASTKTATVIKDSFDQIEILSTTSPANTFTISGTGDINSLYIDQPIQFIPTVYTNTITNISQNSISVLATTGGTINLIEVTSTAQLTVNMPVTFGGVTYGGVASGFTYYITAIADDTSLQVSTTLGGAVTFLTNGVGAMTLEYPSNNSHLAGSTDNMAIHLPIYFTGAPLSSIVAGTTYYINEIYGEDSFTISSDLVEIIASATTAVSNSITVLPDTSGLVSINPIIFTGTSLGGIVEETKYYINHIIDATRISVSSSVIDTSATATAAGSNLITCESTAGFIIGNPIILTGTTFGGIVNDRTYYIHYVSNLTSFTISNTSSPVSITATATTAGTNFITVNSVTNLTPLTPIKFSGTAFGGISNVVNYFINRIVGSQITLAVLIVEVVATQTAQTSNLIHVGSTAGFVANNPIIFTGNTFGGIVSGQVYYVSAINSAEDFTISATPGGSAVSLTDGTGLLTARTTGSSPSLTTDSGSMTGTTRFVGTPLTVLTDTGNVAVRTTADALTLTTDTGSMIGVSTVFKEALAFDAGTMTGTFSVPLIGGINAGSTYYIKTIGASTFTVSESPGGPTTTVTTDAGSMTMGELGWDHITPGTPSVSSFDSSTVYNIEPRITYSSPAFGTGLAVLPTQAPGTQYTSIAYGAGNLVAVANANATIAIRYKNTIVWTTGTLPTSATWASVAYGNNYWVIISSGGSGIPGSKVLYSNSNLATWKTAYLPSISAWKKVVYGNGTFVALSSSGSIAYSKDYGATWTNAISVGVTWTDIAYGAGKFVTVAGTNALPSNQSRVSSDGITWTSSTLTTSAGWSSIAYGNGRFVAVRDVLGPANYSLDGVSWSSSLYSVTGTALAYGQGVFVLVGSGTTTVYSSEDGIVWKTRVAVPRVVSSIAFSFTATDAGEFFTAGGQNEGSSLNIGARTKARASVTGGVFQEINEWETGSNYTTSPTITVTDSNATIPVEVSLLTGNYVLSNPTFINKGSGYNTNTTSITINGGGYADRYQLGLGLIVKELTRLPRAGDNFAFNGDDLVYKVTDAIALDGTSAPNIMAKIFVSPEIIVSTSPDHDTIVTIRTRYSQCRLTNHDFLNIGYGNFEQSNYPLTPTTTVLSAENETIETNYGRVFYSSTDQDGNFRVGKLFAVEQATGIVTLSASQFGLEGLTELKLGGVSVGSNSVIITQFSVDQTFVANSNQIVPTQRAIKGYLTARLSQGGSNTFTGQLIAGTVLVGGPDRIASTIPNGNQGSRITMPNIVNIRGVGDGADGGYGGWDGNGMALAYFFKTLVRPPEE
jgi:hypothetical protein